MSEHAAGAALGTAPAPPIVSGKVAEIADGVFIVPDGRIPLVPNVGVIVGDHAGALSATDPRSTSAASGR